MPKQFSLGDNLPAMPKPFFFVGVGVGGGLGGGGGGGYIIFSQLLIFSQQKYFSQKYLGIRYCTYKKINFLTTIELVKLKMPQTTGP